MARGRNLLTVRTIASAIGNAAKTKVRAELSDGGGLVLRCPPSGRAKWTYAYRSRAEGGMKRITLGMYGDEPPALTLSAARAARDKEEARNFTGDDPRRAQDREVAAAASAATSFAELCDSYINHIKTRPNPKASWKNDEGYLKRPKQTFGKRPVRSITRSEIRAFLETISSPSSANRTQSVIRSMWGYAQDRDIITENFLHGMKRVGGKETGKTRNLTVSEIKAFLAALDDAEASVTKPVRIALKLILLTAQRPGEVAGMTRAELYDLDGPSPHWIIPRERTKSRIADHTVPLSPSAVALINDACGLDEDSLDAAARNDLPVFAGRFEGVQTMARHSLSQAVRRVLSNMENAAAFTPHDLRRTAATLVQAARLPVDFVKALLNHNDKGVTGIYARWHMFEEKHEAVLSIESAVLGAQSRA